jgi:hypothetical protein
MKNESNTHNSRSAIRKSSAFLLGVTFLSMLIFVSPAQAQTCIYSQSFGRFASTCFTTNNTGNVWVAVNGSWQLQEYYQVGASWIYVYHYGPRLWTAENRSTGALFVKNAQGQWITYATYNATRALSSLTTLLQSQNQASAPTFTIVPYDWRGDYCRNMRYFQQYYANLGYPTVSISPLC